MALEITEQNFDEVLKSELPVLIDFSATWCGPCKQLAPIVEEVATAYEGKAIVGKADVEECSAITARFRIRNVPTLLFFKNGEAKDKLVGSVSKSAIEEKLNALM